MTLKELAVTVEDVRTSVLAPLSDRLQATAHQPLSLLERPHLVQVSLRIGNSPRLLEKIGDALGGSLPLAPNRVVVCEAGAVVRLAPDEWLILAESEEAEVLSPSLQAALAGEGHLIDVSAQRTTLVLRGPHAREVLARFCAVDLHPRVFCPGMAAQTLVADCAVILMLRDATPTFTIGVRSSYARHLACVLLEALEGRL
jgi:sarcosine oxidase, subunit gamma